MTTRRARKVFFERAPGTPPPLSLSLERRVRFNETDPMGIVWFGRYARYIEEGAAELSRLCGLSYQDYMAEGLMAPVAAYHTDYLSPLQLDECFTIITSLIWNEGARLNTEYSIVKADGTLAARAYTVQVFIRADDRSVLMVTPPLLERCRARWQAGGFKDLQA